MAMKKKGVSSLTLIVLAILIIGIVAILYFYIGKGVILTPEEQKTAKSLDLTPKEFKEVSINAYGTLIKGKSFYEAFENPERMISYSKLENLEEYKGYYNFENLKIKPGSKIIMVEFAPRSPTPYIIYLVEDGKIKVLVEELYPEGELA